MTEKNYSHFNEIDREKSIFPADFSVRDNSTDRVLMSANGYLAVAVALFFIGLFGFLLNAIVLIIMLKEKSLRTPFNVILFNLVCSDLAVSVLGSPITFAAAVHGKWIFGRTVCVAYGFLMALAGITSIATITVLSFERYLNVAKPIHSRLFTIGRAKRVVCGIWIYSFLLTFPPLVGWADYVNESANISCSVNWEHKNVATTMYIVFLFTMGLAVPVCVICFSYAKIILIISRKKLRHYHKNRSEEKISAMIAVMIAVFLLAWTPYAALALTIAFGHSSVVTPSISVVPAVIAKSSICYNPIIYAGFNSQIREAGCKIFGLKRRVGKPRQGDRGSMSETVNTQELLTLSGAAKKKRGAAAAANETRCVTEHGGEGPETRGEAETAA